MTCFPTIKDLLSYALTVLPAGLLAQGIYITPGAQLVMNGPSQLILNNAGITNNGSVATGNSTVWFTGNDTTRAGFIGGSNATTFYRMVVNRQYGNVQLLQPVFVTDSIRMNHGNLLLTTYGLNLNTSGYITGESEQSHITGNNGGYVQAVRIVKFTPVNVNPGNIGIDIATAVNPGTLTVIRGHTRQTLPNGEQSIQRNFNILASRNSGLNAALRIHYLDAELTGINEGALTMYKGSDLTSGYLAAGRDSIDTTNNVVVKSEIDRLTRFTLGSDSLTGDQPILVTNPVARQTVKPEELNENLSDKIQVFPVPARDYFILTVSGERKQRSEYLLYDEAGHLLQRKKVFLLAGSNSISWDISGYPAGMYYLTCGNGKMQKIRILKQ